MEINFTGEAYLEVYRAFWDVADKVVNHPVRGPEFIALRVLIATGGRFVFLLTSDHI
jgi:hypothetical protein